MTTAIRGTSAQAAAELMLEKLFTDMYGRVTFPIDPVALATSMGFSVNVASFPLEDRHNPIYGVVTHKAEQRTITMERGSKEQQRCVSAALIAGEFLHNDTDEYGYILHANPIRSEDMDYMVNFAMNFLMPGFAVRNLWSEGHSVKNMARTFGVPREIMETRLYDLNLI